MTIRNLSPLLHPRSVALIGASERAGSLGAAVLDNILAGGFPGRIHAVNPHRVERAGVHWANSVGALPEAPDLAVVMTPAETVPTIIAELGERGNRCAVVLSAGITGGNGLRQAMLDAARPHLLRVVGPNCLGIAAPHARLDATFARTDVKAGHLALISQSGALVTAMLDWAGSRGIGFSGIVSAGDMADVDLGDLIDLFAVDPDTDAILLYVEGVANAAKFLTAASAAARGKPVIAIKAGRSAVAARAAFSHTGALAGSYDVYRAAFERAGIVMVDTLGELFDAAEMLCASRQADGDRLAIVTNGGGAGILAIDAIEQAGARPASFSVRTLAALDTALPPGWSHGNPVDVIGDAGPDRYVAAIRAVLGDEGADALLIMNCPTGTTDPSAIAAAAIAEVKAARAGGNGKPVLACWLGDCNADAVRGPMTAAAIPLFSTPDEAVRAFGYLVAARRARRALTDSPAATRETVRDVAEARRIIAGVRAGQRTTLTEVEAKALLEAYHIPTVPTRFADCVDAVGDACRSLAPPYAVKIVSPDISHKSDIGGVVLDLPDAAAAAEAARAMEAGVRQARPEATLLGFAVEQMCERPHAYEVIAGIATDPVFGPLLMVGAGGTAVEILADKALALPPVDHAQALALIGRTRIARLLQGYRNVPPADVDGLADVLDALSAITVDLPDIMELDINPLLVDADGVIALDARIRITQEPATASHLVLRPAPMEWATTLMTREGLPVFIRPVRADDEPLLADFFAHVSPEDLRFRFLTGLKTVDHDRLAMMTRVDYRRTISFLAFDEARGTVVATAMLATDPDRTHAEVALTTRSDRKGKGISWVLFEHVLRYAAAERIGTVEAIECADHEAAIRMEREMGFTATADPGDPTMRIVRRILPMEAA